MWVARRLRADRGRAVGSQAPSSPSRGTRSVRLTQPSNGRTILHRVVPSDSPFSTTTHTVPAGSGLGFPRRAGTPESQRRVIAWPRVLGQPLWAKPGRVRRRARFHQSLGLPRRNNLPAPIFFLPTLPARTQKCIAKGHKPAEIPLSRLREALGVYAEAFSGALLKTLGTGPGPI